MLKADNLRTSCAVGTKSGNLNFLENSGPLRACNGTVYFITSIRREPSSGRNRAHYSVLGDCILYCWFMLKLQRSMPRLCRRKWVRVDAEVIPVRVGFDCEADCKECFQSVQREVRILKPLTIKAHSDPGQFGVYLELVVSTF